MLLEILLTTTVCGLFGGSYLVYHRLSNKSDSDSPLSESQLRLMMLQPKISWCRFLENVDDYGKKVSSQYKTIAQIQATSMHMLKQKFNVQEVTFARYYQAMDSSNQILMDNLIKIIPLLETLDHLGASENTNRQELVNKIQGLVSLNDQLIEKLNELIINLSQLKNLHGPDQQTTQFLLENLDKLVERAKHY